MEHLLMSYLSNESQIKLIKEMNEYASRFGLRLTDSDIQVLLTNRRESLKEHQRVEFHSGILDKLIRAFCDSDFIFQETYVETIARLQDIFYLYKNESMDDWTDDELINIMRDAFDGECQGSLAYLEGTCLEQFARKTRMKTHKYIGKYVKYNEEI